MNEIEKKLKAPFKKIHWRIGRKSGTKAMVLAYVNARDVRKRLDEVIGFYNWQVRYPRDGYCEIGIRQSSLEKGTSHDDWLWKGDGAGETKVEAEKGQYSDAFKRAAVCWGIGMYLYYLKNNWVEVDGNNQFTPPELPAWAQYKPEDSDEQKTA